MGIALPGAVRIGGIERRVLKARIVFVQVLRQPCIGSLDGADLCQPQGFDQAILQRRKRRSTRPLAWGE